ncbi:MAG: hypothetical protein QMD06_01530 [Candidatus Altarchaeum sp.]|nr:hypothetical protein [Candidatus Altarchaeum sp.]
MKGKNLNYKLLRVVAVAEILILSILISGCIDSGEKVVKEGDSVKVNITESGTTHTIFINNVSADGKNNSFEKELIGMKVGEKKNINYEEVVSVKLSQEPKINVIYISSKQSIKVLNITDTQFYVESASGYQQVFPRVLEINADSFKSAFGNKNFVKDKIYINLTFLPWPVKVVDVKTIIHNQTIEILDAGNFSYSYLER